MSEQTQSVLSVKKEVFIYKIPPRQAGRGHRAADWNITKPNFVGRLRMISEGLNVLLKLEDPNTGALFAQAIVTGFPGPIVEPVIDSSRYYVLKITNPEGNHAFVGLGFGERGDAFDFNVTLQDFFDREKKEQEIQRKYEAMPASDYGLKEGQTIKINLKVNPPKPKDNSSGYVRSVPPVDGKKCQVLLPPPGSTYTNPTTSNNPIMQTNMISQPMNNNNNINQDLLGAFSLNAPSAPDSTQRSNKPQTLDDLLGF